MLMKLTPRCIILIIWNMMFIRIILCELGIVICPTIKKERKFENGQFQIQSNSVITNSLGPGKFVRYYRGSL